MPECRWVVIQWSTPVSLKNPTQICPHRVPKLENWTKQLEALEGVLVILQIPFQEQHVIVGHAVSAAKPKPHVEVTIGLANLFQEIKKCG